MIPPLIGMKDTTLKIQLFVNKEHKMVKASKRGERPTTQLPPPPGMQKIDEKQPTVLQAFRKGKEMK